MKTTKTILAAVMLGAGSIPAGAQLLNPGFELSRADGSIANWEAVISVPLPLEGATDPCYIDSVFFRTANAHTGTSALELRNVSCYDEIIYGRIFASDDIPAWGPSLPYTDRPDGFSFYYKFFPVGGDGIYYSVRLSDDAGEMVASTDTVFYSAGTGEYTRVFFPLNYVSDHIPARMYMYYSIVGSSGTGTDVQPGSRLLLDDIAAGQGEATELKETVNSGITALYYPTITSDVLYITLPGLKGPLPALVYIYDISGRQVAIQNVTFDGNNPANIPVSNFQQGMYIAKVVTGKGSSVARFIRR